MTSNFISQTLHTNRTIFTFNESISNKEGEVKSLHKISKKVRKYQQDLIDIMNEVDGKADEIALCIISNSSDIEEDKKNILINFIKGGREADFVYRSKKYNVDKDEAVIMFNHLISIKNNVEDKASNNRKKINDILKAKFKNQDISILASSINSYRVDQIAIKIDQVLSQGKVDNKFVKTPQRMAFINAINNSIGLSFCKKYPIKELQDGLNEVDGGKVRFYQLCELFYSGAFSIQEGDANKKKTIEDKYLAMYRNTHSHTKINKIRSKDIETDLFVAIRRTINYISSINNLISILQGSFFKQIVIEDYLKEAAKIIVCYKADFIGNNESITKEKEVFYVRRLNYGTLNILKSLVLKTSNVSSTIKRKDLQQGERNNIKHLKDNYNLCKLKEEKMHRPYNQGTPAFALANLLNDKLSYASAVMSLSELNN